MSMGELLRYSSGIGADYASRLFEPAGHSTRKIYAKKWLPPEEGSHTVFKTLLLQVRKELIPRHFQRVVLLNNRIQEAAQREVLFLDHATLGQRTQCLTNH